MFEAIFWLLIIFLPLIVALGLTYYISKNIFNILKWIVAFAVGLLILMIILAAIENSKSPAIKILILFSVLVIGVLIVIYSCQQMGIL